MTHGRCGVCPIRCLPVFINTFFIVFLKMRVWLIFSVSSPSLLALSAPKFLPFKPTALPVSLSVSPGNLKQVLTAWFGPMMVIQVSVDVVCHDRRRPASSTAKHSQWKTVSSSFGTLTKPLVETAAAATTPEVDLTSDWRNKRVARTHFLPRLYPFLGWSFQLKLSISCIFWSVDQSYQNRRCSGSGTRVTPRVPAPAPSVPPTIDVKKLDISNQNTRPAIPQLPKPLSDDVPIYLT